MSHLMSRGGLCARPDGHNGQHLSPDNLARQRAWQLEYKRKRYAEDAELRTRINNRNRKNLRKRVHGFSDAEYERYLNLGCYLQGPRCTVTATDIDHRHLPPDHPSEWHSCAACRVGPACRRCNSDGVRETMEHFEGVEWTVHRLKMFSSTTGWTPPESDLIAQGGNLAAAHLLITKTGLLHAA